MYSIYRLYILLKYILFIRKQFKNGYTHEYFWNISLCKGVNVNYTNIDELAKKVGGSLRLTTLVINRARQIVKKAPILIETNIDDPVRIAFMELKQGKIGLHEGGEQPSEIPGQKRLSESAEKV
jgi:DNA-directed RNA polymerase subunit omega